jgi:2,3-bisphosphoglycerate-dependent phosphoglycerate mutase
MYKQFDLKYYFSIIFLAILLSCNSSQSPDAKAKAQTEEKSTEQTAPRDTAIAYDAGAFKLENGGRVEVPFFGQQEAVHFYIVRHADKELQGDDPALSVAGKARAERLGKVLSGLRVDAICTTNLKRTIQTGEVLYHHLKAPPFQTFAPAMMSTWLSDAIMEGKGKGFVHVGHSNTIPELLKQLGVTEPVKIDETDYDNLFVVGVLNGKAKMKWLRYE